MRGDGVAARQRAASWYQQIEPGIRRHVRLLRDNGFNTFSSCKHRMEVRLDMLSREDDLARLDRVLAQSEFEDYAILVRLARRSGVPGFRFEAVVQFGTALPGASGPLPRRGGKRRRAEGSNELGSAGFLRGNFDGVLLLAVLAQAICLAGGAFARAALVFRDVAPRSARAVVVMHTVGLRLLGFVDGIELWSVRHCDLPLVEQFNVTAYHIGTCLL
jgi:hypothetical protein